jgi:hypothetical protein
VWFSHPPPPYPLLSVKSTRLRIESIESGDRLLVHI